MSEQLYNKKSKEELKKKLNDESFKRNTLSFYKYVHINESKLESLRNELYSELDKFSVLGRIYIASEGINAQISVPDYNKILLYDYFKSIQLLDGIHIKDAIEEGQSFYKLTIKIKNEIVAYNINPDEYNMDKVGQHLSPNEFNEALENPDTVVVDIRNHYESEVGRFENAIVPDVDRSQELLPEIKKMLSGKENNKILLYCTGGIRCEKASSYLIQNNFNDVNQLNGGIINYANKVKEQKLQTKFIGKNFVFDHRLGERVTNDIISTCHQCNRKNDNHKNCANDICHLLFIQCDSCEAKLQGCCSKECYDYLCLDDREMEKQKKNFLEFNRQRHQGKVKPKLYDILN